MADVLTWDQVYEQFTQYFGQQDYQGAYDLITAGRDQLPEQVEAVDYYRLCALARLGQHQELFQMLEDKMAQGFWYSEFLMRQSPSFAPLQGNAEFEQLIAKNLDLMSKDVQESRVSIEEPQGASQPYPAIIALHGNGQNNTASFEAWKPAAAQGWLIAAPLSSQQMWRGSAVWDEYERATNDVTAAYEKIKDKIDPERLIIGGFSMGGQTAIQMGLEGKFGANKFIALGPGGAGMDKPEEYFAPMFEAAKARGVRGYIAMGDIDTTIPQEAIQRLVSMFNEAGIPCGFEWVTGSAHVYPDNFAEIIARGIAFVEQQ